MTRRFRKQAEIYKRFCDCESVDLSQNALTEMFDYESKGIGNCNVDDRFNEYLLTGRIQNGYAIGKKMVNITISMWFDYIKDHGHYDFIKELYEEFPKWFIDSVFKKYLEEKKKFLYQK